MQVVIELPGIRAISRNQTTGHYWNYKSVLNQAEEWMVTFGKRHEHHFTKQVDILIEAYVDVVNGYKKVGRTGKIRTEYFNVIDSPNVDDKIFTDTLNRYKPSKLGKVERPVWFIEDDGPAYLRTVSKRVLKSSQNKVVITITEVEHQSDLEKRLRSEGCTCPMLNENTFAASAQCPIHHSMVR